MGIGKVSRARPLPVLAAAMFVACDVIAAPGDELRPSPRVVGPRGGAIALERPERVTIQGYDGNAMEPFLTRDGQYLLFNNLNRSPENTNLHYAERVDDVTFRYQGEIEGVNTPDLEGVPTMDRYGNLYFVSPRTYILTLSTIHRGVFSHGRVSGVELVPGISGMQAGIVNFEVEVSPDGDTLYFVDGLITGKSAPETADLVVAVRRGAAFERLGSSDALMRNVNTSALEYAPCVSADGLTLFFTRAFLGKWPTTAILVARRNSVSASFGQPIVVRGIDGFVEAPTLSPDERSLYYHRQDGSRFVIDRLVLPQTIAYRPE